MDFPPDEKEVYRLRKGDLLLSEASGSSDQVGKPAIWNDELPICCFQNTVIRLQSRTVSPAYVLVLLQYCYFNHVFAGLATGVGINHLGAHRLARIVVPVAAQEEQRYIATEVAQQLDSMRLSKVAIESSVLQAKELQSAVLAKAFSGNLVEPVATPAESAAALAERLTLLRSQVPNSPPPVSQRRTTLMTFSAQAQAVARHSSRASRRNHTGGTASRSAFCSRRGRGVLCRTVVDSWILLRGTGGRWVTAC